jgi:hypothetical protein
MTLGMYWRVLDPVTHNQFRATGRNRWAEGNAHREVVHERKPNGVKQAINIASDEMEFPGPQHPARIPN